MVSSSHPLTIAGSEASHSPPPSTSGTVDGTSRMDARSVVSASVAPSDSVSQVQRGKRAKKTTKVYDDDDASDPALCKEENQLSKFIFQFYFIDNKLIRIFRM
jgi:hypothetical protein